MKNDPRLIKGAKFLENIALMKFLSLLMFKGSMSLVGPRPLFPEDNQYFDETI